MFDFLGLAAAAAQMKIPHNAQATVLAFPYYSHFNPINPSP
jgi:hypothetical protein